MFGQLFSLIKVKKCIPSIMLIAMLSSHTVVQEEWRVGFWVRSPRRTWTVCAMKKKKQKIQNVGGFRR